MSDTKTRLDNLAEAYGKSALEIRRLKQRCLALEALAQGYANKIDSFDDFHRAECAERIAQIRAEKGGEG